MRLLFFSLAALCFCISVLCLRFSTLLSAAPSPQISPNARRVFDWQDARISECSGLAASRRNAGMVWTHNDSGDSARVFLVDLKGVTRATVEFQGAQAEDWEDMAVATHAGESWIYGGDIGDNPQTRAEIVIYRMREPKIALSGTLSALSLPCERMTLRYPDGAHDAETLAVSPRGQILIVSKNPTASGFYAVPKFQNGARQTLKKIGEYAFADSKNTRRFNPRLATGGDFSPDGKFLVVTTYTQAHQWKWPAGDLKTIFQNAPRVADLPKLRQAESICYSVDGRSLLVSSEGKHATLWQLPLP